MTNSFKKFLNYFERNKIITNKSYNSKYQDKL